jgi:hypothetical protein
VVKLGSLILQYKCAEQGNKCNQQQINKTTHVQNSTAAAKGVDCCFSACSLVVMRSQPVRTKAIPANHASNSPVVAEQAAAAAAAAAK